MKRKTKLSILVAATTILGASLLSAADPSAKQTLEGKVTPMVTMNICYGLDQMYKGFIDYVMPAGTFFTGPVYDAKGDLLKKGDILATIDPEYFILQNQADELAYQDAADQYQRNMASGEAISKRDLAKAKIAVLTAKAKAQMSKLIVEDVCTLRARFDGYVNQVLFSGGWANGLPATINISQLDPIYISIPLDQAVTSPSFNYNTPVTVYPTSDKPGAAPVGYIQGRTCDSKEGNLMILVHNKPLPPPVNLKTKEGKDIPVVKTWCPIMEHGGILGNYYSDHSLLVSKYALFGKDGDHYVWLVEGSKAGMPGKGINYLNKVKKIKVETDGKIVSVPSFVGMVTFNPKNEKAGADDIGNVLLSNQDCPEGLQDGDTVCLFAGMYTFMPGDKVKVEIGPTPTNIQ